MNRTVAFVSFSTLAGLGIIGSILVILFKPEYASALTGILVNLLGLVTVAAGTFYSLGKVDEKVQKIKEQTNGTTTTLIEENMRKEELIRRLLQQNQHLRIEHDEENSHTRIP